MALLYTLQAQLYQDFYCRGGLTGNKADAHGSTVPAHSFNLTRELSEANGGCGPWETGWVVRRSVDQQIFLERNGLVLCLPASIAAEAITPNGGPGESPRLHLPKQFLNLSPGFYVALSDQSMVEEEVLLRFYWNLTPPGAVLWMKRLTAQLNSAGLSFKCKVLNNPAAYHRCDAGVLYVPKKDFIPVVRILEEVYPEVQPCLKPPTPVFTKRLADGLGLAEDPGQGESLGMQRCRILAEGLLRAHEQGKRTVTERLAVVESHFLEEGIRIDQPYLNPGSQDDYSFHPRPLRRKPLKTSTKVLPHAAAEDDYLHTAVEIGKHIANKAIWFGQFCNWLGPKLDEHGTVTGQPVDAYGALGPDLYAGTGGVALFLGELYDRSGDPVLRKATLGAIRQALAGADAIPAAVRAGLYNGWTGIALVAARLSRLLDEPELAEKARRLLHATIQAVAQSNPFDILAGRAGAVAACVILRDILGDPDCIEFAVRMGDELIDEAIPSAEGLSWKTPGIRYEKNLTGFSHGAAGVAYALLELSSVTGETRFLLAAQRAFDYERRWFDHRAGNWPDFREHGLPGPRGKKAYAFSLAWCHGAPGIALSRLRAYELLHDPRCKDEAEVALRTTHHAVADVLKTGMGNYSLCHGLAGNAEALRYGAQVLAPGSVDKSGPAFQAGIVGNRRYARPGRAWPCGSPGGESPGLMTGLAGIGYFYLRLSGAPAPLVLLPRREEFVGSRQ